MKKSSLQISKAIHKKTSYCKGLIAIEIESGNSCGSDQIMTASTPGQKLCKRTKKSLTDPDSLK